MALCFEVIIEKNPAKILTLRDSDKFLCTLANFTQENCKEVRNISKRSLCFLLKNCVGNTRSEVEKIL